MITQFDGKGQVIDSTTRGVSGTETACPFLPTIDSRFARKRPPNPDGPGVSTDIVSIYRERREPQPGGEVTLYWSYLGDARTPEQIRCANCGRTLDEDVDVCPTCSSNEIGHSKTED